MTGVENAPATISRRRGAAMVGFASLCLLLALWGGGFVWFLRAMPSRIVNTTEHTDAIVALTGGSQRLEEALKLLASGISDRLFITGVHHDVDVDELLRLDPGMPRGLATSIELGYEAPDTAGNAAETASWMRRHEFHSLRLVTAYYHLPRSLFEFHMEMPDIKIIPNPVFPPAIHAGKWWERPAALGLVVMEYNKYLAARLRRLFQLPTPVPETL